MVVVAAQKRGRRGGGGGRAGARVRKSKALVGGLLRREEHVRRCENVCARGMQEDMMKRMMSDPAMRKKMEEFSANMMKPENKEKMLQSIQDPVRRAQAEALMNGDMSVLDSDPELRKAYDAQMKAMADMPKSPDVFKAMTSDPRFKERTAQMMDMMRDPEFASKLAELRDDPELGPRLQQLQNEGFGGMMKVMQDKEFLTKLAVKLEPLERQMNEKQRQQGGAVPQMQAASATPPQREVETLFDAARLNDVEATADILAVDDTAVNAQDEEGRTPLHLACAFGAHSVVAEILDGASNVDLELRDSKENTVLHYAAGYGRLDSVRALIDAGANAGARNASGKTAADVAKLDERNPVGLDAELMKLLKS